jgi:hypothetical protein
MITGSPTPEEERKCNFYHFQFECEVQSIKKERTNELNGKFDNS